MVQGLQRSAFNANIPPPGHDVIHFLTKVTSLAVWERGQTVPFEQALARID